MENSTNRRRNAPQRQVVQWVDRRGVSIGSIEPSFRSAERYARAVRDSGRVLPGTTIFINPAIRKG